MTARIGATGMDLFTRPRPELLAGVVPLQLEPGADWVDIEDRPDQRGFRSTQRLWISEVAEGVAAATWPAEKGKQARYLYDRKLGSALVTAAKKHGWIVEASPHIAFFNSRPDQRLYMTCPAIELLDYVAYWEADGALSRVRYAREDVERYLWPWLKRRGIADDSDNAELRRFLDEVLGMRNADIRPAFRFRKVWTFDQVRELGLRFGETIRSEFDAVFAAAHEPKLGTLQRLDRKP